MGEDLEEPAAKRARNGTLLIQLQVSLIAGAYSTLAGVHFPPKFSHRYFVAPLISSRFHLTSKISSVNFNLQGIFF